MQPGKTDIAGNCPNYNLLSSSKLCQMENSILYSDLMNEPLEFRSTVRLLPLVAVQ